MVLGGVGWGAVDVHTSQRNLGHHSLADTLALMLQLLWVIYTAARFSHYCSETTANFEKRFGDFS